MKLTLKDLEEICHQQRNRIEYLGLDISMHHRQKGNQELILWNVHDRGHIGSTLAKFVNKPDIATAQMVQWVSLMVLPESM